MVAIRVYLLAAGQDKILKPEAAALHPVSGQGDIILPVRRLGIGVQADDACKIVRVFLHKGGGVHLPAGGQCLPRQQRHVFLGDGKVCSGSGMWSNGAVWSAAGYTGYAGTRAECLKKLYNELAAGRPVIVHLKNTTVSGVKRHANRTSTYEYHLTSSGWDEVNYPHIATSSTYGHWVCVAGISSTADPENLTESDFYALDPARVTANGRLAVTRLLDHTLWVENSPLKVLG